MPDRIFQAFETLKRSEATHPEVWKPIYRDGLREALQQGQHDQAAQLAAFAAICLESQGYYDDAVAELEFAIDQTTPSAAITVNLLGTLATLQAIRGESLAFDSLAATQALLPHLTGAQARVEIAIQRALVECIFFREGSIQLARDVANEAQQEGFLWLSRGLDIWAVPAMVARGDRRRAVPWVNSLGAYAEVENSRHRYADFAALDFGLRSVSEFPDLDHGPFERASYNNMAVWRAHITLLHNAVVQRNATAAQAALDRLHAIAGRLNPGHTDGLPAFEAAARLAGDDLGAEPLPPPEVTLVNLPAVLAAMEVVATRGRQEAAVIWERWATTHLPEHLHTSIEWPSSLARVHALLLVRMGKDRAGIAMMERALQWCRSAGYPIEAALCEVQLSELLALGPTEAPERRWATLRRSGRAALAKFGIDPIPPAFAATEALTWGRAANAEPKLSPREVEVLSLLAEGHTYREIGDMLSIEWRTVQVHAGHIYEKLGASGKVRAARRAQELGII